MSWVLPVRWRNRQAQTRSERAVVLSDKKERMEVRALVSYVMGIISGTLYLGHQNKAGCSDRAKGHSQ